MKDYFVELAEVVCEDSGMRLEFCGGEILTYLGEVLIPEEIVNQLVSSSPKIFEEVADQLRCYVDNMANELGLEAKLDMKPRPSNVAIAAE